MRQRKPANIEKDLQDNAAAIISDPFCLRGRWQAALMPQATEIRLDLGCGKGGFLAQVALAHPDILFIGLDNNQVCVARTAEKLLREGAVNARVALCNAADLTQAFAACELSRIYLNFNSPFPPKKYAEKRLTHLNHLLEYRQLLGQGGILDMRTDHHPYWQFTLTQMELAGYEIFRQTENLHEQPQGFDVFKSEYDQMTVSRGAIVRAFQAHPGPALAHAPQQTAPLGLVSYLPPDLDALERIPYGMEGTIENLRNRAKNAQRRQASKQTLPPAP